MKIHWIRKHKGYNNFDKRRCWYFDWNSACGYSGCLHHTVIRKNVTCETCLKIMKLQGKGV